MSNQVDTSQETVDAEFEALAKSSGLDFDAVEGVVLEHDTEADAHVKSAPVAQAIGETHDMKIHIAVVGIQNTLGMAFAVAAIKVPEEKTQKFAEAWAEIIVRYYPGGFLEFLAKNQHWVNAAMATFGLTGAVIAGVREKRKRESRTCKSRRGGGQRCRRESDGTMVLLIGVSRSGKSVFLKRAIESEPRVLAFDPKGEYPAQMEFTKCESRAELLNALQSSPGDARIAYVSRGKKEFDFFCACAFTWNRQAPAVIVCEELAEVTHSGKADGNWGRLVSQGLAFQPTIYATVQRGQEVDKSVMNNATYLHITRHNTTDDQEYIAKKLGCDVCLIPGEPLKFIQWTSDKGVVVNGTVDFVKNRPNKFWKNGQPRFRTKPGDDKKRLVLKVGKAGMFEQIAYR